LVLISIAADGDMMFTFTIGSYSLSTKPPNPKVEMNLKEPPITGAGAGAAASPPAPSTLRRNPPRSARPPPTPLPNSKPSQISRLLEEAAERLKVFLRIRPLPLPERKGKAKSPTNPKQVCLVANSPNSVALTVPHSKLLDPKRGRTEVFDGFSSVFSPDSSQVRFSLRSDCIHPSC
jgi:hypothetical protein